MVLLEVAHEIYLSFKTLSYEYYAIIFTSFFICNFVYIFTQNFFSKVSSKYRDLTKSDQIEWQTRVVSSLHGVLVFFIVVYVLFFHEDGIHLTKDPFYTSTALTSRCFAISTGYFLADFFMVVRHKITPFAPVIAHHVFAGIGFMTVISEYGAGRATGICAYLLLTEGTSLPNNTYWKLQKMELEKSLLGKFFGKLFVISWIVCRLSLAPWLFYLTYIHINTILNQSMWISILFWANMLFLNGLNIVYWIIGPFRDIWTGKSTSEITSKILDQKNIKVE